MSEHFCLKWNNHQTTLVSVFDKLLECESLVDCTLAADGRYMKAHKVVLSACSSYLEVSILSGAIFFCCKSEQNWLFTFTLFYYRKY